MGEFANFRGFVVNADWNFVTASMLDLHKDGVRTIQSTGLQVSFAAPKQRVSSVSASGRLYDWHVVAPRDLQQRCLIAEKVAAATMSKAKPRMLCLTPYITTGCRLKVRKDQDRHADRQSGRKGRGRR